MELELLKKFCDNGINMWNPNTNYLVYLAHFEKVLNYCIDNKKYELTYEEWLRLLNSDSEGSKKGSETHNICHALNIIDSTYKYRDSREPNSIIISIPREILYQNLIDDRKISSETWKIIQNRYFDYLNKHNIFELQNLSHIQSVCLNLYVCYLIDSGKKTLSELADYIDFSKNRGENIQEKLNKVYNSDICKVSANLLEKLNISSNRHELPNSHIFLNAIMQSLNTSEIVDGKDEATQVVIIDDRITGGYNMIYYGTPGCGKSYMVNKNFNTSEYSVYRTTFHPEYSNSDFIGQIIPKTENSEIKYEFQEGPFSIALLNAIKNPTKKVCLIIEEINRGNASAIFGDIFQLLDRNADGSSIYEIINEPIRDYLLKNGINTNKITIPSNLWIVATMNTSDQNVFALDTAFKRRWRMHRIRNEFDNSNPYDEKLASMYVPGSSYTWKEFISAINNEIMRRNPTGINSEDKQLGVYFVTENELAFEANGSSKDKIDKFVEKVLLYIWEDVAKIDSSLWFGEDIKSFDDLVKEYYTNNLRVFRDMFLDQLNSNPQLREPNEENN